MSEDPSSLYAPPVVPPGMPVLQEAVPSQIKVFGILHLVFGGLGLILVIGGLAMQGVTQAMLAKQEQLGGVQGVQAQLSREMTAAMQGYTWFQSAGSVLLGILLLIAGIGLLKRKKSGLRWSNVYGWSALALRLAGLVMFLVVVLPRINGAFERLLSTATGGPGKLDGSVLAVTKAAMIGGAIGGILGYSIYPVLVLILLNREKVRRALS